MLRKTFFLATIAILSLIASRFLFAAEEWTKSDVEDQNVEFRAVYFADERNGWVVGDEAFEQKGMIAQTTNRGVTWTFYENPFDRALYDVFFISPKKGWAVGVSNAPIDKSIVIATTNGGKTWKPQNMENVLNVQTQQPIDIFNNLYGVFFVDEKLGFAVGMGETILRTTNGGRKWEVLMGGETTTAVGEGDITLLDAYFMRKKVGDKEKVFGWVVGQNGVILYTEDAEKKLLNAEDVGKTWVKQELKDAEGVLIETNLNDIFFVDENNGWIVGVDGLILQTTDSGKTWQNVDSGTEEDLYKVSFAPKTKVGWIVGTYGTILHTVDGKTWQPKNEAVAKGLKLNAIFTFDKKNSWIAGEWDTILRYAK